MIDKNIDYFYIFIFFPNASIMIVIMIINLFIFYVNTIEETKGIKSDNKK